MIEKHRRQKKPRAHPHFVWADPERFYVERMTAALAHIDSSWVYPGDEDYRGLLKENDLTAEAFARTDEVQGWIAEAQRIAAEAVEPAVDTGSHCDTPFECGFYGYCSRNEPKPEFPVYWLPRFSSSKAQELASQCVYDLSAVPDDLLNDKQQRVKDHIMLGTPKPSWQLTDVKGPWNQPVAPLILNIANRIACFYALNEKTQATLETHPRE